jgi:hypothetical protein
VTAALSTNTAPEIDRTTSKRRRQQVEEDEEGVPIHLKRVTSYTDLAKMVRAYYGGKQVVTKILPVGIDTRGVDEWDDTEVNTGTPRFTDYIDATRQFGGDQFARRLEAVKMYERQTVLSNYTHQEASGNISFYPHADIRNTGLLRFFRCGPGGGFIEKASTEIFNYMLPQFMVTVEEAREKLERVNAAIGVHEDLSTKSLEELVGSSGDDCYADPHDYSAIHIDDGEMVEGDVGVNSFKRIINSNYHIVTTLCHNNRIRFNFLSREKNALGMRNFMARLAKDMRLMFNSHSTEGVPQVYGKLYRESNRLMSSIAHCAKDSEK